MNASQESSDFVEPAPRPLRPDQPVQASTSRVTLDPVANSQVELLSDESNDHDAAALAATAEANGHHLQANETTQTGSTSAKQMSPPAASPSKVKVFLKSTSPDVPLHFHLPRELSHTLTKKLQVTIKAHGGVMESRFGKADLIVVDPQLKGVSKRLLRDANQMGQPIPVIVPDYIYDCAAQGEQLDFQDTKYKYHPALALADPEPAIQADPAPRTLNGRNPFTESDRQAIVSYFVDKQESSWSLNAAARELAVRVPTHTYTSFQSYLQANFDKGWNLKQKILAARRDIIQGEPSELQARIFRSQYTASPGLQEQSEQSAPSDGWPRASPQPQAEPAAEAQPSTTSQNGREPPLEQATLSQSDDNDQDLLVRRPNPGTAIDNVEKSPTKTIQPVQHAASEESDPGTSPPPSFPLSQRPPGSRFSQRSPSADEESDPEHYSPRIMSQIQQAESSRHKPSQKPKQPKRRPSRDSQSSSDFDSELDQTDQGSDQDLLTTGPPATQTTLRHRTRAQESEDSEWHGSRRLDSKMRLAHSQATTDKRVKFLQKEKDDLFKKLVEHVMSRGSDIPPSTQDAMLDKPTDAFWNQFAALHPRHSAASWRSHYLKNRLIYKQIVELKIQDRREEEGSADEEDTSHAESQDELASQSQQSQQQGVAAQADLPQTDVVARQHVSKELESDSDPSVNSEDVSMPADGIVIMLPRQPTQGPPAKHVSPEHEWPEAPPPPPIEDEDEDQDMMQVESQVNTLAEATPLIEEEEEEEEEDEDEDEEEEEEEDEDEEEEEDEDEEDEEEEEMPLPPPSPEHSEFEAELESVEDISDNEINDDVGRSPTKSPAPSPSRTTHFVEPPSTSAVEAGTPVLVQHRDAPFYDFTMDSDEEQRIRQARSRPSLPNMQLRQGVVSSGPPHRPPITTDRVLGHFATPSRSQKTAATRHISLTAPRAKDDRIERTREWTRSVSAASSSASPELVAQVEPVAITESSRSRASRIDQRPLLGTVSAADVTPSRLQARSQLARRPLSGGYVPGGGAPRPTSSTSTRSRAQPVVADFEAARLEYRAEAERFRRDFGLDREQRNTLLKQFNGNIKDARKYIASWLQDMQDAYAVEAAVAFEYVKASQGDFEQAEAFLRLAAMTRSSSTPSRSTSALSRSFSGSVSPAKRSGRIEDNSLSRLIRKIDHNQPSSKRVRR